MSHDLGHATMTLAILDNAAIGQDVRADDGRVIGVVTAMRPNIQVTLDDSALREGWTLTPFSALPHMTVTAQANGGRR